MTQLGDFPAAVVYALNTFVALAVSFGLGLSPDMTGAITVIATAVFGMIAALKTRPVSIAAFGAAAATALAAFAAFGFALSPDQIGYTVAAISVVLGFLTHQSVSPVGGELDRPVRR